MKITLIPGRRYSAGVDLPWYVTEARAKDEFHKLGFRNVFMTEARDDLRRSWAPYVPEAREDNWDTFAKGDYHGPARTVDLPTPIRWMHLHAEFGDKAQPRDQSPITRMVPPDLVKTAKHIDHGLSRLAGAGLILGGVFMLFRRKDDDL